MVRHQVLQQGEAAEAGRHLWRAERQAPQLRELRGVWRQPQLGRLRALAFEDRQRRQRREAADLLVPHVVDAAADDSHVLDGGRQHRGRGSLRRQSRAAIAGAR